MSGSPRRLRPLRSILVAALGALTLTSSGCATVIGGELIQGEPPRSPPMDPATPVQWVHVKPTGEGGAARLRLRLGLDDGTITERDAEVPGAGGLPVIVQLDTTQPEVGRPARRVEPTGRLGLAAPLTSEELATHVVAVIPPSRDRAWLFAPSDPNTPAHDVYLDPLEQPLGGVRTALRVLLTPALIVVDLATLPLQAMVLLPLMGSNFRLGC